VQKIDFEIRPDLGCTTPKTARKVVFFCVILVSGFYVLCAEQSRIYVRIFSDMDRLPQLVKYYHRCEEKLILQQWRNLVEIQQDESAPCLINAGYDMLLSSWHAQVTHTKGVLLSEENQRKDGGKILWGAILVFSN